MDPTLQSHPVPFFVGDINTNNGIFFTSSRPATLAVVTFISMVNTSAGSGDTIYIEVLPSGGGQGQFWSGNVGAGVADRFPLTCEIPLLVGDKIGWTAAAGTWGVVITGYYCPQVFTS